MPQDHISQKRAVYTVAGMERAMVRQDLVYRTGADGPLTMDVYSPEDRIATTPLPAVVLVAGYNDVGYQKMLGVKFKEMAMSVSWSQLIAASGLIAITYTNREPAADLDALLHHVREHADALGIDGDRIGVLACSGNVPLALSSLIAHGCTLPHLRRTALRVHAGSGRRDRRRRGRGGIPLYEPERGKVARGPAAGSAVVHRPRRTGTVREPE